MGIKEGAVALLLFNAQCHVSHNVIISTRFIILEAASFEVIVLSGQEELVGSLQHRIIAITMPSHLPDDLEAIARA